MFLACGRVFFNVVGITLGKIGMWATLGSNMANREQLDQLSSAAVEAQMFAQMDDIDMDIKALDKLAGTVLALGSPVVCESKLQTYFMNSDRDTVGTDIHVPYINRPYTAGIFGGFTQIRRIDQDKTAGEIVRRQAFYIVFDSYARTSGYVSPVEQSTLHDVEADTVDSEACGELLDYLLGNGRDVQVLRNLVINIDDETELRAAQAYIKSLIRPADLFSSVVSAHIQILYTNSDAIGYFNSSVGVDITPHDTFEIVTTSRNSSELFIRSRFDPAILIPVNKIEGSCVPKQ